MLCDHTRSDYMQRARVHINAQVHPCFLGPQEIACNWKGDLVGETIPIKINKYKTILPMMNKLDVFVM